VFDFFWDRVEIGAPDECWLWRGRPNRGGYGYVWFDGRQERAHRVAYYLAQGEWPAPQCLHLPLDGQGPHDRRCCNPLHLYAGTNRDNVGDRLPLSGARNGRYKVDPDAVRAAEGSAKAVGKRYGISDARVRQLRAS